MATQRWRSMEPQGISTLETSQRLTSRVRLLLNVGSKRQAPLQTSSCAAKVKSRLAKGGRWASHLAKYAFGQSHQRHQRFSTFPHLRRITTARGIMLLLYGME